MSPYTLSEYNFTRVTKKWENHEWIKVRSELIIPGGYYIFRSQISNDGYLYGKMSNTFVLGAYDPIHEPINPIQIVSVNTTHAILTTVTPSVENAGGDGSPRFGYHYTDKET